jgi:hypothetical protein
MLINKLLTRKGWRVVAHCALAAAGIGLLYLIVRTAIIDAKPGGVAGWFALGVGIVFSLWLVALGTMLAKAELTGWR